eukprot:Rmarinus@m.17083
MEVPLTMRLTKAKAKPKLDSCFLPKGFSQLSAALATPCPRSVTGYPGWPTPLRPRPTASATMQRKLEKTLKVVRKVLMILAATAKAKGMIMMMIMVVVGGATRATTMQVIPRKAVTAA